MASGLVVAPSPNSLTHTSVTALTSNPFPPAPPPTTPVPAPLSTDKLMEDQAHARQAIDAYVSTARAAPHHTAPHSRVQRGAARHRHAVCKWRHAPPAVQTRRAGGWWGASSRLISDLRSDAVPPGCSMDGAAPRLPPPWVGRSLPTNGPTEWMPESGVLQQQWAPPPRPSPAPPTS